MWDNHQTLDFLSSWLFVVAVLIAGCLISQWAINLPVFPLQEMTVRGSGDGGRLRHVTREQIDNVVRSEIMGNFLTVDLEATRKAFSKLPWVRAASVRRTWPKGLDVTLEEHVARARWAVTRSWAPAAKFSMLPPTRNCRYLKVRWKIQVKWSGSMPRSANCCVGCNRTSSR